MQAKVNAGYGSCVVAVLVYYTVTSHAQHFPTCFRGPVLLRFLLCLIERRPQEGETESHDFSWRLSFTKIRSLTSWFITFFNEKIHKG